MADFIFLGSKITADSDYRHETKRCLLLGTKAMTNLDRILKKLRYHFVNQGPYSQSYVLFCFCFSPVVMYRCESWTIKKAES